MARKPSYDELIKKCENLQRQLNNDEETIRDLRRNEERYRTILDTMEEGFSELDLAGNLTFVNDAEAKMLGYSKEEIIGINYSRYTSKQTSKILYEVFHRVYKTGEPSLLEDYEIIMKDGTKRIHEISAALIRDTSGRPVGFRGLSRDITKRKRVEETLRES